MLAKSAVPFLKRNSRSFGAAVRLTSISLPRYAGNGYPHLVLLLPQGSVRHFAGRRRDSAETGGPSESDKGKKEEENENKQKDERPGENVETESSSTTHGEKVAVLGWTAWGLSMFLRNPAAARALGVAGPGGLVIGAAMSVYELGGWKLVCMIPTTVLVYVGATKWSNTNGEEKVKENIIELSTTNCSELPPDFAEAVKNAVGSEFETNKFELKSTWRSGKDGARSHWQVTCSATRPSRFSSWTISSLKVSTGTVALDGDAGTGLPPPQTRFWNADGDQVQWRKLWEM